MQRRPLGIGRDLIAAGWPWKVVEDRLERMCARRLIEYGTSIATPWLTREGREELARLERIAHNQDSAIQPQPTTEQAMPLTITDPTAAYVPATFADIGAGEVFKIADKCYHKNSPTNGTAWSFADAQIVSLAAGTPVAARGGELTISL